MQRCRPDAARFTRCETRGVNCTSDLQPRQFTPCIPSSTAQIVVEGPYILHTFHHITIADSHCWTTAVHCCLMFGRFAIHHDGLCGFIWQMRAAGRSTRNAMELPTWKWQVQLSCCRPAARRNRNCWLRRKATQQICPCETASGISRSCCMQHAARCDAKAAPQVSRPAFLSINSFSCRTLVETSLCWHCSLPNPEAGGLAACPAARTTPCARHKATHTC